MKYVYLIQSLESGYYKIGVSNNPQKRIKQLQTGNPTVLRLIYTFESEYSHQIESFFHKRFSYCRKEGEWFDLDIINEVNFLDECNKISNGLFNVYKNNKIIT